MAGFVVDNPLEPLTASGVYGTGVGLPIPETVGNNRGR